MPLSRLEISKFLLLCYLFVFMDLINVVEPLYSNEKEQLQEQISVLALANSSIAMTMNMQRINECKIMDDYI